MKVKHFSVNVHVDMVKRYSRSQIFVKYFLFLSLEEDNTKGEEDMDESQNKEEEDDEDDSTSSDDDDDDEDVNEDKLAELRSKLKSEMGDAAVASDADDVILALYTVVIE